MKHLFISAVIGLTALFTSIVPAREIPTTIYPATFVVTSISTETDTVTIIDFNGFQFTFYGTEDWAVDDVVSCIMDSKGTPCILDDEIVSIRYSGYFDGWMK